MLPNDKTWITPVTKALINEKWLAYKQKNWAKFRHLRVKVRHEVRKAKEMWASKLKKSNYGLWKLTKYLSGKAGARGHGFVLSNTNSKEEMAEKIANEMTTDFSSSRMQDISQPFNINEWKIEFSVQDVAMQLKKLQANKASGADRIPNRIYVILAEVIAAPLKTVFDRSVAEHNLPSQWKEGVVVPIPKTNPPQANKVRLITLLPTPSKILERLVLDSVRKQLEPLFGRRQHAFRKNCSTSTALLQITDRATQIYDELDFSGFAVMSFDLSKAFDKVDHHTLLRKLTGQGLPTAFIKWIQGYLSQRTFRVRVQDSLSVKRAFNVGVPQGSVLGPALFCVMAGDFTVALPQSSLTQYADDLTILSPV